MLGEVHRNGGDLYYTYNTMMDCLKELMRVLKHDGEGKEGDEAEEARLLGAAMNYRGIREKEHIFVRQSCVASIANNLVNCHNLVRTPSTT